MTAQVLYVEDDPFTARLIGDGLAATGYRVEVVPSIGAALAVLSRFAGGKPDVGVFDIALADGDAAGLVEQLRRRRAMFPFLLLSGLPRPYVLDLGHELGAAAAFVKPVYIPELVAQITVVTGQAPPHKAPEVWVPVPVCSRWSAVDACRILSRFAHPPLTMPEERVLAAVLSELDRGLCVHAAAAGLLDARDEVLEAHLPAVLRKSGVETLRDLHRKAWQLVTGRADEHPDRAVAD